MRRVEKHMSGGDAFHLVTALCCSFSGVLRYQVVKYLPGDYNGTWTPTTYVSYPGTLKKKSLNSHISLEQCETWFNNCMCPNVRSCCEFFVLGYNKGPLNTTMGK